MFKVSHKKKLFDMCRISEYYVIFIYFQAAVSALLAVLVLYVEKNLNEYYAIFDNSTNIKALYF